MTTPPEDLQEPTCAVCGVCESWHARTGCTQWTPAVAEALQDESMNMLEYIADTDGSCPCCECAEFISNFLKKIGYPAAAKCVEAAQTKICRLEAELATARSERDHEKDARKHTQKWYTLHYGKLHDWARTRLPEQWVNEFFSCIANGTWGHADIGERYKCVAGFDVVPSNYFKMPTAQEQILHEQYVRAENAEAELSAARSERDKLKRGPEFYAYTPGLISDERLEGMIDETRWWKVPGDEVYEVVRELRESRKQLAAARSESTRLRKALKLVGTIWRNKVGEWIVKHPDYRAALSESPCTKEGE